MKLTDKKPAHKSLTVQSGVVGVIISVVAMVTNYMGWNIGIELITGLATAIATLVTSIIAIYGRYKATRLIE